MFCLKENVQSTAAADLWALVDTPYSITDAAKGVFKIPYTFNQKDTTFAFTLYGNTNPGAAPEVYADNALDYLAP